MHSRSTLVALAALSPLIGAGICSAAPIGPNLLTNGSFEDGFAGWTEHTSLIEQVHDASGTFGTPPDGSNYLFISRSTTYTGWTSSVSRTTEPLTVGEEYTVSGYYKNWGEIPTLNVTLRVGSEDVVNLPVTSTQGQWVYVEGSFVATSVTPTFQIRIVGSQTAQLNLGIDGLAIHAVPEPASLGVLGGGALMLMARRRRA